MTADFARHMGWCGRFALAVSSCFFAFAGASSAGDTADATRPSIQSVFESTVVKLNAKPDVQTIPVEWTYTNHFDGPLMVERFDQSCGCLAGQTDAQIVEPGKSGSIKATFTPGAYRGLIRKSIHVRFVNHAQPVELVMETQIPSPVELSTNELSWEPGQSTTQTIDVKSGTGAPFAITGLLGVAGLFDNLGRALTTAHHPTSATIPLRPPSPVSRPAPPVPSGPPAPLTTAAASPTRPTCTASRPSTLTTASSSG